MNPRWLMKAKRWAQNPPSAKQVIFYLSIVAICIGIAGFEWFWGWPDWLTVNNTRFRP